MSHLAVVYAPLDALEAWERNPHKHALAGIIASIRRFGFLDPVGVNEQTGELVEGHGRVEALRYLQDTHQAVPAGIEVRDERWWVPTVALSLSRVDQEGYAIAHNRTTERGGYDFSRLIAVTDEVTLDQLPGWEQADVALLAFLRDKDEAVVLLGGEETPLGFSPLVRFRIGDEAYRRFSSWATDNGFGGLNEAAFAYLVERVYAHLSCSEGH